MNQLEVIEPPTFAPSDIEIEAERQYWNEMDRVAECEAWFVSEAEAQETDAAQEDEDECHDDCFCSECRSSWDEYQELDRDYRRSTRGF
jgi:hypothetical protein